MADSWCGWQPVEAGSHKECVHHNIMPEAVFEVIKPTYVSLTNKALPERGDAKPKWGFQCHDLEFVAQTWICWCWSGGAISTSGCSPLYAAWSCHLPQWLFYEKWDALQGALLYPMCSSKVPKESGKLKSRLVRSRNTGEKLWKRRRKGFEEKEVEADGQTYEPGAFWPQLLWVTCVFLKLKLCAFWRSAAHSVHDNFATVHCGPIKVYVFEVCGFIASAWIKWFSRKLSFSTFYPSQKWVHKCFVSASGKLLVISVTISQAVLNHSFMH